jgi:hypothetical protein
MGSRPKSTPKSFWSTVPGILSGVATLLAAVAALIGALVGLGLFGDNEEKAALAESLASVRVLFQATSTENSTKFEVLRAARVPPGVTLTLTCTGGGCFSGTRKRYVPDGAEAVFFAEEVPRLRPGAVLSVHLSKPKAIGKLVRYRVGRAEVPRAEYLCVPPRQKPVPC